MGLLSRISHDAVSGIRVGRFGSRINTSCYVYRIGDTFIDTGPPNQWKEVRQFAAECSLNRVLLTHHHEDHSGNALRLARKFGATILAPEKTIPLLRNGFKLRPYQKIVWGKPKLLQAKSVPDCIEIEGGFHLKTCPTPGHATTRSPQKGRRWRPGSTGPDASMLARSAIPGDR